MKQLTVSRHRRAFRINAALTLPVAVLSVLFLFLPAFWKIDHDDATFATLLLLLFTSNDDPMTLARLAASLPIAITLFTTAVLLYYGFSRAFAVSASVCPSLYLSLSAGQIVLGAEFLFWSQSAPIVFLILAIVITALAVTQSIWFLCFIRAERNDSK